MEYQVFARKYRPQQFDEIVGQEPIVTILKNALKQNRLAQSFLFVGSRGVGKTSTARILAKALNCEAQKREPFESCGQCGTCQEIATGSGFDVLEIDGASNRGIDEIRNLRDNVKFKPMHGRYKVYIIDEVHMLTQEAFNALLKTLEEPPEHVKFIFATTESHKIPQTILSRCQRFDFRQIRASLIVDALKQIAIREKIKVEEKVLFLVAKNAEGSLRDAESLLDKLAGSLSKEIGLAEALNVLGTTDSSIYFELMDKLISRQANEVLALIAAEEESGRDLGHFTNGFLEMLRDLMMVKAAKTPEKFLTVPDEDKIQLFDLAARVTLKELLYFFTVIQNGYRNMRFSVFPKIDLEVALLKLVARESMENLAEVLKRLDQPTGENQRAMAKENTAPAPQPSLSEKIERDQATPKATTVVGQVSPSQPVARSTKQETNLMVGDEEVPLPEEAPGEDATEDLGEPDVSAIANPGQDTAASGFEEIRRNWGAVLQAVKASKMSVGTFLSPGVPISLDQGRVVVGFAAEHKFNKENVEAKQNKQLIEQQLKKVLGRELRVEFIINNLLEHAGAGATAMPDLKEDKEMQNVIQSAIELFQGRVLGER